MAYIYFFTSQRRPESQFSSKMFFIASPMKKHQYQDPIAVFSKCVHFNLAQFPHFLCVCQVKRLRERDMSCLRLRARQTPPVLFVHLQNDMCLYDFPGDVLQNPLTAFKLGHCVVDPQKPLACSLNRKCKSSTGKNGWHYIGFLNNHKGLMFK